MTPDDFTDLALDARGHNLHQARLIANRTPEVDSLLEHVHELARTATPEQRDHLAGMLTIIRRLAASNSREGQLEQSLAGAAEEIAADLRERRIRGALGVKAIANALREPLGVLAHPERHTASRYVAASAVLDDVLGRVSAEKMTALSVRHELGVRKYSTLVELVEARQAASS